MCLFSRSADPSSISAWLKTNNKNYNSASLHMSQVYRGGKKACGSRPKEQRWRCSPWVSFLLLMSLPPPRGKAVYLTIPLLRPGTYGPLRSLIRRTFDVQTTASSWGWNRLPTLQSVLSMHSHGRKYYVDQQWVSWYNT